MYAWHNEWKWICEDSYEDRNGDDENMWIPKSIQSCSKDQSHLVLVEILKVIYCGLYQWLLGRFMKEKEEWVLVNYLKYVLVLVYIELRCNMGEIGHFLACISMFACGWDSDASIEPSKAIGKVLTHFTCVLISVCPYWVKFQL